MRPHGKGSPAAKADLLPAGQPKREAFTAMDMHSHFSFQSGQSYNLCTRVARCGRVPPRYHMFMTLHANLDLLNNARHRCHESINTQARSLKVLHKTAPVDA